MNLSFMKTDYSFLFSGSSGKSSQNNGISNMNFLADYASIKNGSYGKLLKAYYKKVVGSEGSTNTAEKQETSGTGASDTTISTSADPATVLRKIDQAADQLKASADAMTATGEKSVFTQKEVEKKQEDGSVSKEMEYDKEAIYQAVEGFVKDYNSLIDAVQDSSSSNIKAAASNMTNLTSIYSRSLASVGITIGEDKKLQINSETLKNTEISKLQNVFHQTPSFGNSIASQASFIDFKAAKEAAKANTYNQSAFYNDNYSVGNLFEGMF